MGARKTVTQVLDELAEIGSLISATWIFAFMLVTGHFERLMAVLMIILAIFF